MEVYYNISIYLFISIYIYCARIIFYEICDYATYTIYLYRPPEGYENPLFAPARKWQVIREEKARLAEENKFNRPFYFKEITKRSPRHKYRTGGR